MNRSQIYSEIEETFGLIPTMFKVIPDATLELEWKLFKQTQLVEGVLPNKTKELIGIAISGATKCRYCSYFHTEMARLNGASEAEIEDAAHYAKATTGWSTYVNSLQIDFETFKAEVNSACEFVRGKQAGG
jgi:AhpD family alkylhydroperoxidase